MERGSDKSEKQINAILNLSQDKSFTNAIKLSPRNNSGLIDVNIDQSRVKRFINWSRIGSLAAMAIFVLSLFYIHDEVSIGIFQQVSFFGLILILFASPFSKYTGTMWAWGRFGTKITEPSPAFLVKLIGWMLLLAPIIYELQSKFN